MTYHEDNNVFYQEGNIPVILTFPHSGLSLIDGVSTRKKGVIDGDNFTDIVADYVVQMFNCIGCNCCSKDLKDDCGSCNPENCCCDSVVHPVDYNTFKFNLQCLRPFVIYSKINRKHCDFNRAKDLAFEDQRLSEIYDQYHATIARYIDMATKLVRGDHSRVLLLDMHGQSDLRGHILRGTRDLDTVQPMIKKFGIDSLNGPHSLLGYMNSKGVPVFPMQVPFKYDTKQKATEAPKSTKVNLDSFTEHPHYRGAFTVHNYSTTKPINCIQVELGIELRKPDQMGRVVKILRDAIFEFYNHYQKIE